MFPKAPLLSINHRVEADNKIQCGVVDHFNMKNCTKEELISSSSPIQSIYPALVSSLQNRR